MEQKKVTQVKELDQHLEKLAFLDDIPQEENGKLYKQYLAMFYVSYLYGSSRCR